MRQLTVVSLLARRLVAVAGVVGALMGFGASAYAAESAVQFTGFAAFGTGDYTVGWSFTVNQPTQVTSLGYFDAQSNGLAGAHEVGIWNSAGVLVVSAVVPAGAAAPLSGGFRYVSIPATLLTPGNYMIGGQSNGSDIFWADVSGFSTSPLITYGTAHYTPSTTLSRPTIDRPDVHKAYFGPSMLISAAPLDTPPTASAGIDLSVDEGDPSVILNGSGSSDADGDPITYSWVQLPGGTPVALSNSQTAHPSFAAPYVPIGGETLSFELTVTANNQTATDTVSVTIVNVNHTPVAYAGDDQSVAEGTLVTLHGETSFDPDGDEAQPGFSYRWAQISGSPVVALAAPDTKNPTFVAPFLGSGGAPGVVATLEFELRVDDGFTADAPAPGFTFASVVDRVTVLITNTNNPPAADAGDNQTVDEHGSVTLTGNASADPDNDPLSLTWVQIAGPPVSLVDADTAEPSFTAPYVSSGGADLTFQVTVDDSYGGMANDTVVIHVQNVNDPPLASAARPTIAIIWPPNHRLVTVGIAGVADPNNNATITITSVTQDEPTNGLGDGDTAVDAIIGANGTVVLRAERASKGDGRVYWITFTASDPEGSASGVVEVAVPQSPNKPAIDSGQVFDSTH